MIRIGLAAVAGLLLAATVAAAPWRWPAGVAPPRIPAGNAMSKAKIALGRRLFYDADLSIDGTMACATCHEQKRGFADGNRTRPGVHGDPGRRNVPGLANVAWISPLTSADPAMTTLEAQVAVPVLGETPVEMGMKGQEAEIARRLAGDACYATMFAAAFPERRGTIDFATISAALAAFERTMTSYGSPYDVAGRAPPALFARHCGACHAGSNFTDGRYHRIDRPDPRAADPGLAEKSGRPGDIGRFRTAPLRNIALAPPYLHDGSAATLPDAIRAHRAVPGIATLSDADRTELAGFIASLTDQAFLTDQRLAMPDKACGKRL